MDKLEPQEYRILEIGLTNLLELYAEIGTPAGSEKAILEFERLRDKLNKINSVK